MRRIHKMGILAVVILLTIAIVNMVVSAPNIEAEMSLEVITVELPPIVELVVQEEIKPLHDEKDIELLARIIQAESMAEPYIGKAAVGAVIINRMKYRDQTMKEVIYGKNQFNGVGTKLFNMEISEDCRNAAIEALDGVDPVDGAEYFINPKHCNPKWTKNLTVVKTIGNHKFFKRK